MMKKIIQVGNTMPDTPRFHNRTPGRVYSSKGLCPTLRNKGGDGVPYIIEENNMEDYNGLRIRRLTPKECWRLMGFSDEDFEKARAVNSDTQLYKQAGNSIVVDVLVAILRNLLTGDREEQEIQRELW